MMSFLHNHLIPVIFFLAWMIIISLRDHLFNMYEIKLMLWYSSWSSTSTLWPELFRDFFLFVFCKSAQCDRQCQTWRNNTPQWAGITAQVLPWNWRVWQLDSLSLFCCSCCLNFIWTGEPHRRCNKWIHENLIHVPDFCAQSTCTGQSHCQDIDALCQHVGLLMWEQALGSDMKTKYRHRLCVQNDIQRLRLSQIQPSISESCASSQTHCSH